MAAQFATVQGRVVDRAEGFPLQGVHLLLDDGEGERVGTATDADGVFAVVRIPPGRYVLTASFVGYTPFVDTLDLDFGDVRALEIELGADQQELDEVVVASERAEEGGLQGAGLDRVRPSALARVPMPDVSADLMTYLLTMPGVVTAGDRGGQLFIRGGTPTQNLVLIDGMRIYQPFHIIGFYSIFPADLLAYADVYAGGFGARYGGYISSVIDVAMRNGSKERVRGAASVAPFLSSIRVEAPFVPGKVSVLASARESVIQRLAPDVLGRELPYRFGDVFLKTHAYLSKTSSFSATAIHTFDEGNIADTEGEIQESRWKNQALGLRYTYLPPESPVMAQLAVYTSQFDSRYAPGIDHERRAAIDAYIADIDFIYLLGDQQVHFGLFGGSTTFRYNLSGAREDTRESITEGGVFLEGRLRLGEHLGMEPGLRLHSFAHGVHAALEPRLRLRWRPGGADGRQEFSGAWGLYHQQIVGLNNQRDVTDAFVAWASTPLNEPVSKAMHLIAGWQRKVGASVDVGVESYYKQMYDLIFPRFDAAFEALNRVDRVDGDARGIDLRLEVSRSWFYGYVGYGLALVQYERWAERVVEASTSEGPPAPVRARVAERFSPPHDRRHQLNAVLQAAHGPYRLSARWQYGSGLPFTQVHGYYEDVPVGAGDFHTRSGTTHISYGAPYAARLPSYHRLDVSVDRRFEARRWTATLQAALINVYDRANIFNYDLLTHRRVDQLPLIPSVGLKVELH